MTPQARARRTRRRRAVARLAAGVLVAAAARAPAQDTFLSIRQGWAIVREVRVMDLAKGEQEIELPEVPPGADLSAFSVRSGLVPVELVSWERRAPGAPAAASVSTNAGVLRWTPGGSGGGAQAGEGGAVVCRVRSPAAWKDLPLEIVYRLGGFNWSAHYQVAVRGEQVEEKEPVSVDLLGSVRIANRSPRSFSNAVVRLVGADQDPAAAPRPAEPGFLALDPDNPLGDLWRDPPAERAAEYGYDLPRRVNLEAGRAADFSLVRAVRTPAVRLYSMVSEMFPYEKGEGYAPLRKWIVFRNIPANRMGIALPPGRSDIFLGGMRTHLLQKARFRRAPADTEIRVDLGAADDVVGRRSSSDRTAPAAGYVEETVRIALRNLRDADVVVEIDEKPPVTLGWSVVRANKPYTESARRLLFRTDLKARSEDTVEYRLRIRQPEL